VEIYLILLELGKKEVFKINERVLVSNLRKYHVEFNKRFLGKIGKVVSYNVWNCYKVEFNNDENNYEFFWKEELVSIENLKFKKWIKG